MMPLLSMLVVPLVENVAVPSGTFPPVQLAPSVHSLGSPTLPPTQVASTAWAATIPRQVPVKTVVESSARRRDDRLPMAQIR